MGIASSVSRALSCDLAVFSPVRSDWNFSRRILSARDSDHRLSHIELLHPDDASRFRELGAVANFQPLWALADSYINELTPLTSTATSQPTRRARCRPVKIAPVWARSR
jgi:predicted amidohydrolase YtcJ